MHQVTLDKGQFLKIILKTRELHVTEYHETYEGWLHQLEEHAYLVVDRIAEAKLQYSHRREPCLRCPSFGQLSEPESYENDYDRAVRMLELSVDNRIVLTREEFSNFVLDEWRWTESFKSKVAIYSRRT
ncbi:MAG TPA: hypothetical protein VHB46_02680 [Burkholderiales bacterium]|nr:hypothetical protein [Burkholderiales bacterium]